jgi:hypothetical protein
VSDEPNTEEDEPNIEEIMARIYRERAEAKKRSVARLKARCAPLARIGIQYIVWTYDGSGDSGDIENQSIYDTNNNEVSEEAFFNLVAQLPENEQPLFTGERKMLDDVYELLPSGYENNDGGYGEVHLDVEIKKVRVEHNQRYTDANYSEEEF